MTEENPSKSPMTPEHFEDLLGKARDEAMKFKPPSMTPEEFENLIRTVGDKAVKKVAKEFSSTVKDASCCPYCQQSLDEGVCKHWVAP